MRDLGVRFNVKDCNQMNQSCFALNSKIFYCFKRTAVEGMSPLLVAFALAFISLEVVVV